MNTPSRVTKHEATRIVREATVPAGTYYVGDPCYAVPNDLWMEWLRAADFEVPSREHVLVADIDGKPTVGVFTAYGDGVYQDTEGREYPVDAGLIGLVPKEVAEVSFTEGVVEVTFPHSVTCHYADGVIHLGPIIIDTKWD